MCLAVCLAVSVCGWSKARARGTSHESPADLKRQCRGARLARLAGPAACALASPGCWSRVHRSCAQHAPHAQVPFPAFPLRPLRLCSALLALLTGSLESLDLSMTPRAALVEPDPQHGQDIRMQAMQDRGGLIARLSHAVTCWPFAAPIFNSPTRSAQHAACQSPTPRPVLPSQPHRSQITDYRYAGRSARDTMSLLSALRSPRCSGCGSPPVTSPQPRSRAPGQREHRNYGRGRSRHGHPFSSVRLGALCMGHCTSGMGRCTPGAGAQRRPSVPTAASRLHH